VSYNVKAQSNENYIYKKTYQEKVITSTGSFVDETASIQEVTYFDGLGRPKQSVGISQSATQNDMVTHFEYDQYGRMEKEYLPYSTGIGTLGSFRNNAKTATGDFYNVPKYENTTNPYTEKEFDNSPLNKVVKRAAPGASWAMGSGHEVEMDYLTNTNADNVRQFEVSLSYANGIYTPSLTVRTGNSNLYDQSELLKAVVKNENHPGTSTKNFTKEEYKDKEGRVILSRTFADYPIIEAPEDDNPSEALAFQNNDPLGENTQTAVPHDTYYVYDDFGNLSFVLTPKMNAGSSSLSNINSNLASLGYQNTYDHKNRLVEKKFPGKAVEYIVYNKLDQPVLTQDGNQRLNNQWLFKKYDVFGRTVYTGLATSTLSRTQLQNAADSYTGAQWVSKTTAENTIGGVAMNYDNTGFPNTIITETLSINYYDDYNFDLDGSTSTVTAYGVQNSTNTKNLNTGTKVKVIDANEPNKWVTTVSYYDEKGKTIYTYENNNYLATTLMVEYELDFTGKILKSSTRHIKDGKTITTLDEFTYDHAGRILSNTQCIGDGLLCYECTKSNGTASSTTDIDKELIFYSTYDELGQHVAQKKVGGIANESIANSAGLQTVDYSYNIRNLLTAINDNNTANNVLDLSSTDLFGIKINYDQPTASSALFDGNISEISWKTQNTDNSLKQYQYTYDAIGRIKSAVDNTGNYNLNNVEYDKNGNITKLKRNGWKNSADYSNMDDMVYNYTGNSLLSLNDNGDKNFGFIDRSNASTINEYLYDANGNMTLDYNKGITNVDYSLNNLPIKVDFDSNENIQYVYDAVGIKQRKIVSNGTITDYAGNYGYENDELKFFNQPEGYIESENNDYSYVYQYKDNLGNIRLSYSDADNNGLINAQTEILEEHNYYPFGMKHKGYNGVTQGVANNFKYNGKEIDNEFGLGWYHYGFRMYDPAMARFTGIDPISDEFAFVSTYNYAENSPIGFIDLHGLQKKRYEMNFFEKIYDTYKHNKEVNAPYEKSWKEAKQDLSEGMGKLYDAAPEIMYFIGDNWNDTGDYIGLLGAAVPPLAPAAEVFDIAFTTGGHIFQIPLSIEKGELDKLLASGISEVTSHKIGKMLEGQWSKLTEGLPKDWMSKVDDWFVGVVIAGGTTAAEGPTADVLIYIKTQHDNALYNEDGTMKKQENSNNNNNQSQSVWEWLNNYLMSTF